MPADQIGYPKVCTSFTGVDEIGSDSSIDESLSIWNRSAGGCTAGKVKVGSNVTIMRNVRMVLTDLEECQTSGIQVADNVIVNYGAFLSGEGGLYIGQNVLIGPYAMFLSGGHTIDSHEEIFFAPLINKAIYIERDSWIGANAKILGGIKIGLGAVVAAGALVNKDVPSYAVVGGIPCKIIKFRSNSKLSRIDKLIYKISYNFFYKSIYKHLSK